MGITTLSAGALPFKLFGIPLAAERRPSSDYSTLMDDITSRLHSWP